MHDAEGQHLELPTHVPVHATARLEADNEAGVLAWAMSYTWIHVV